MGLNTKPNFVLTAMAWVSLGSAALAADYKPGFPCPRPTNDDLLAVEICSNDEMARAELTYEKTYYAHRQQDGVLAYKALKIQANAYSDILRSNCELPAVGSSTPMPPTAPACYVSQITSQTKEWNASLHGDALQEGLRDIDAHIAAQRKLIESGFLPPTAKADGVYGDATRIAIVSWQQKQGFPATGFISDSQLANLLQDATPSATASPPAQADSEQSLATATERATPAPEPPPTVPAPQPTPPVSESPATSGISEKAFLSLVADLHSRYEGASNDFLKGAIFQQRAAALRSLTANGTAVTDWSGKIYKLSSNGDGFGVLEVTLSSDAWVTTWNNSFSDTGDHTLITPSSPVYPVLGTLTEGDEVVFSGRLLTTDDQDVLHTNGMSMDSKLTEPEFLFVFTDIKKK